MAAETRSEEIDRKDVSLRDYLEDKVEAAAARLGDKIDAAVERLSDRITADENLSLQIRALAKEAIDKYEAAQRQRDVVSNEFRATLEDQAGRLVSTATFEAALKDIAARFDSNRERIIALEKHNAEISAAVQQKTKGAETSFQWINAAVGVLGLIAGAVLAYLFRPPN